MEQSHRVYESFVAFMEAEVIPRRSANPYDVRLDGRRPAEGYDENAGYLLHHGKEWTVRGNTRYEPLILAYDAMIKGDTADPFKEEMNKEGNMCLVLTDEIRQRMKQPRIKHMYIYRYGAG